MSELIGESVTVSHNGVESTHRITSVSFDPVMWGANGDVARMEVTLTFRDEGYITIPKAKYDEMVNHD